MNTPKIDTQKLFLNYIKCFNYEHKRSPSDMEIAKGLDCEIKVVQKVIRDLLQDGLIQISLTLLGKEIDVI